MHALNKVTWDAFIRLQTQLIQNILKFSVVYEMDKVHVY